MNNQLTQVEIAKVFAMYLGNPVQLEDGQISKKLTLVSADGSIWVDYNEIGDTEHDANFCKLLLTPLSAITDEHAALVAKTNYPKDGHWPLSDQIKWGKETCEEIMKGQTDKDVIWFAGIINVFQLLIQLGYAVPIWFGIGHWANGKTAIELGIAIDSTTLNTDSLSKEPTKEQCPEFPYFGARYPDATCIDGRLWDLDSIEDDGLLHGGGDAVCPFCCMEEYIEDHYDEYMHEDFEYDEATPEMREQAETSAKDKCREDLIKFHKKYDYISSTRIK